MTLTHPPTKISVSAELPEGEVQALLNHRVTQLTPYTLCHCTTCAARNDFTKALAASKMFNV